MNPQAGAGAEEHGWRTDWTILAMEAHAANRPDAEQCVWLGHWLWWWMPDSLTHIHVIEDTAENTT